MRLGSVAATEEIMGGVGDDGGLLLLFCLLTDILTIWASGKKGSGLGGSGLEVLEGGWKRDGGGVEVGERLRSR